MIEAAIFDMDGLLMDSEPFWREAERAVFGELGFELTDAMCEEAMGLRVTEVIAHWFKKHPWPNPEFDRTEREIIRHVDCLIRERAVLMEGVVDTLRFFERKQVPMALASSSAVSLIGTFLDRFGLRRYFRVVHSAEHEEFGKPHPVVFITTARKLTVDPTHCLVFEDSFNGVLAARAARMKCVVVPDPRSFAQARFDLADLKLARLSEWSEEHFRKLIK